MTEKEKMIAGKIYNAGDKDLREARALARQLVFDYNQIDEHESEKRQHILGELLGSMGENVIFEPTIRFDYGFNTKIGSNCLFNFNSVILDCAPVTIGNNVMVGPNLSILTPVHPMIADERNRFIAEDGVAKLLKYAEPVTIGDNVWIAGDVTINPGVTIGDHVVIGSGSVVTRDIPSHTFAAGVPCRVIRELTEEDRILDK